MRKGRLMAALPTPELLSFGGYISLLALRQECYQLSKYSTASIVILLWPSVLSIGTKKIEIALQNGIACELFSALLDGQKKAFKQEAKEMHDIEVEKYENAVIEEPSLDPEDQKM
jgi:hypothetical protein